MLMRRSLNEYKTGEGFLASRWLHQTHAPFVRPRHVWRRNENRLVSGACSHVCCPASHRQRRAVQSVETFAEETDAGAASPTSALPSASAAVVGLHDLACTEAGFESLVSMNRQQEGTVLRDVFVACVKGGQKKSRMGRWVSIMDSLASQRPHVGPVGVR